MPGDSHHNHQEKWCTETKLTDHFSDMVGRWGGLGDEDPPPSPSRHSAGLASRLALLAGRSSPDAERAARADLDLGLATRAQAQEAGHFFVRFDNFPLLCCAGSNRRERG